MKPVTTVLSLIALFTLMVNPAAAQYGGRTWLFSTDLGSDLDFSDPSGTVNVAKLFWARAGAGIVYDLPTEARLDTDRFGVGVFE